MTPFITRKGKPHMRDYLTAIIGADPLPRGTRPTYTGGTWATTLWNGPEKLITLQNAQKRIQSADDAQTVALHCIQQSGLQRLRKWDRIETDYLPLP